MLMIDSISLISGDRILLKGQSNAAYNGIYVVQNAGGPSDAWVIDRALDANKSSELPQGSYVLVATGAQYANTSWVMNQANITMATTGGGSDISWAQFGGAGANVIAGYNMSVSGNTVHLGSDGAGNLSSAIKLMGAGNLIAGSTTVSGMSAMLSFQSGAAINFNSGTQFSLNPGATGNVYANGMLSFASSALVKFGDTQVSGAQLQKLVNGSTLTTGDALHYHSLESMNVRAPKAASSVITSGDAVLTLEASHYYTADKFALPSGGGIASSDIEAFINGQLIEYGTSGNDMPRFAFDRETRQVTFHGSVSGDHVYVRYFPVPSGS